MNTEHTDRTDDVVIELSRFLGRNPRLPITARPGGTDGKRRKLCSLDLELKTVADATIGRVPIAVDLNRLGLHKKDDRRLPVQASGAGNSCHSQARINSDRVSLSTFRCSGNSFHFTSRGVDTARPLQVALLLWGSHAGTSGYAIGRFQAL